MFCDVYDVLRVSWSSRVSLICRSLLWFQGTAASAGLLLYCHGITAVAGAVLFSNYPIYDNSTLTWELLPGFLSTFLVDRYCCGELSPIYKVCVLHLCIHNTEEVATTIECLVRAFFDVWRGDKEPSRCSSELLDPGRGSTIRSNPGLSNGDLHHPSSGCNKFLVVHHCGQELCSSYQQLCCFLSSAPQLAL